jgi:hypothetical protein
LPVIDKPVGDALMLRKSTRMIGRRGSDGYNGRTRHALQRLGMNRGNELRTNKTDLNGLH